jgi:hypothetical protein
LSHSLSPFYVGYFLDRVLFNACGGLDPNPIWASLHSWGWKTCSTIPNHCLRWSLTSMHTPQSTNLPLKNQQQKVKKLCLHYLWKCSWNPVQRIAHSESVKVKLMQFHSDRACAVIISELQ